MMISKKITYMFIVMFALGLIMGFESPVTAQETTEEATENADSTTVAVEATTATPDGTTLVPEVARTLSPEDLNEIQAAQDVLERADAVFQYVLTKIIAEYQINVQTEVLNIRNGAIVPRPTRPTISP